MPAFAAPEVSDPGLALACALLHDVVEDTAATPDEIAAAFGDSVLEQIDETACSSCERRTPPLCLRCYSTRPPRAQELLDAAMAASGKKRDEPRARQSGTRRLTDCTGIRAKPLRGTI